MTIDMGNPGIAGFGYGQGSSSQGNEAPRADNDQSQQQNFQQPPESKPESASAQTLAGNGTTITQATDGAVEQTENQAEVVDLVPLDFEFAEPVPGYEASASDCLNHALSIARNLRHAVLSSDHLMLALTVDQSARRLLDRIGDVARLQEAAMRRLASMHSRYSSGDPSQTADLEDIRIAARASAAERDQRVAISDLINAFPKAGGRLIYGHDPKEAWLDKIEKSLVPRVSDAMTRIEAAVREATQGQRVTVEQFMQDLSARLFRDEQSQRELMEDVRRQVREATEAQASAMKELDEKVSAKLDQLATSSTVGTTEGSPAPRRYWSWIVL